MSCESCCDGTDLGAGDSCSCCGRHNDIIGYRKCEYPMCEADEDRDIPITRY
jgi:hypothetical protein